MASFAALSLLACLVLSCHALSPASPHPGAGTSRLKGLGDWKKDLASQGARRELLGSIGQQHKAIQPHRGLPREEFPLPRSMRMPRRALEKPLGSFECQSFVSSPTCKHAFCTDNATMHPSGGLLGCPAFHAPRLDGAVALYETCDLHSIGFEAEDAVQNLPSRPGFLRSALHPPRAAGPHS